LIENAFSRDPWRRKQFICDGAHFPARSAGKIGLCPYYIRWDPISLCRGDSLVILHNITNVSISILE